MFGKEVPEVVRKSLDASVADAIVAPDSRQASTLLREHADGRVKVYGETDSRGYEIRTGQRTEIDLGAATVVVHKNPHFKHHGALRFNEIEVQVGERTEKIDVKIDPTTGITNYLYEFFAGEQKLGTGYGQQLNLTIASHLLGQDVGGRDDSVPEEVLAWIQSRTEVFF